MTVEELADLYSGCAEMCMDEARRLRFARRANDRVILERWKARAAVFNLAADDFRRICAPADGGDDEGPCTCCDDTGITGQTERFCQCDIGRAMLAADDRGDNG